MAIRQVKIYTFRKKIADTCTSYYKKMKQLKIIEF